MKLANTRRPRTINVPNTVLDRLPTLRRAEDLSTRVLAYASLLPAEEKALLESVFAHNTPVTLIAQAAGWRGVGVRRMRARVRRLVGRVLSPTFRIVARAITRRSLVGVHGAVARSRFLYARTLRQTAAELNLPIHVVRRISAEAQAIAAQQSAPLSLAA